MSIEENVCRLCLNIVDQFEVIDEITREMFDVLSLKMNLDISKNPIMCQECAETLRKSFYFKSVCMESEEIIVSLAHGKGDTALELKDLYKNNENTEEIVNETFICRFCVKLSKRDDYVSMDKLTSDAMFVEILSTFMPEMDLNLIKNLTICSSCRKKWESHFKFAVKCSDVEQKINEYYQSDGIDNMDQINLSNILHLSLQNRCPVKEEVDVFEDTVGMESEVYGKLLKTEESSFIKDETVDMYSEVYEKLPKTEESLLIKDETVNFNENICLSPSEIKMEMCDFENICNKNDEDMKPLEAIEEKCEVFTDESKYESEMKLRTWSFEGNPKEKMSKDALEVKKYKCPVCSYRTNYKPSMKQHEIIHKNPSEVVMYKCTDCSYETKRKGDFDKHVLLHKDVSQVKMYRCTICPYEAKRKNYLTKHLVTHEKVSYNETYPCALCTFETHRKPYLRKHMLTHKDISKRETYKCATCSYEARQKNDLKRHMVKHKSTSELQIYKCDKCTFQTKYKGDLKVHMIRHKDISEIEIYKCATCSYETKIKSNLRKHVLKHSNSAEEEMYSCTMCTYKTKYKRSIKHHMRMHKDAGGEKN